jgi:hypothetical protein
LQETALQAHISLTKKAAERAPPAAPLSSSNTSSDEEEERALAAWRRRGSGSLTPEPPPASVARSLELEHLSRARTTQRRLLAGEPEVNIFSRDASSSTNSSPAGSGLRRAGAQRASLSRYVIRRDHSSSDLRSEAERDAELTLSQSIAYDSRRSWNDYLTSTLRQDDSSGSNAAATTRAADRAARFAAPDVGISARLEAMRASVARLDAIASRRSASAASARAARPAPFPAAADGVLRRELTQGVTLSSNGSPASSQPLSDMFGMERQPRDVLAAAAPPPATAAADAPPAAPAAQAITAARADLGGRAAGFRAYAQARRSRVEEAPQRRQPRRQPELVTPAFCVRARVVEMQQYRDQEVRLRDASRLGIAHYAKAAEMSEEEAQAFFNAEFVRQMRYSRRYIVALFNHATLLQRGELAARPSSWPEGASAYWHHALSDPEELHTMISWAWKHVVALIEAGEALPQMAHRFMDYQLALQDCQEWTSLKIRRLLAHPSDAEARHLAERFNFVPPQPAEGGDAAAAPGTSDGARAIAALPQRARQSVAEPTLL